MTTIVDRELTCAICGKTDTYMLMGSSNTFGPPDLDCRPGPMMRDTLHMWVQRCKSCGYVSADIEEAKPKATDVIKEGRYVAQLDDERFPTDANEFLCRSMIHEAEGEWGAVGWNSLHAAWACDDKGRADAAAICRSRAADFFARAREARVKYSDSVGEEYLILSDALRRAGRLDEALVAVEAGIGRVAGNDFLTRVLEHEKGLVTSGDRDCHNLGEVEGFGG